MIKYSPIVLLSVIFFFSSCSVCSDGDRSPVFKRCLLECNSFFDNTAAVENSAVSTRYSFYYPNKFTAFVFFWNVADECKYQCMHQTEAVLRKLNGPSAVKQYHGKWPFARVLGMQELFSCIFSLFNLLAHSIGYHHIFKKAINVDEKALSMGMDSHPSIFRHYYILSVLTWSCSFIFHARDTKITEFLDYFFAFASLLYALYISIVVIFNVQSAGLRNTIYYSLLFFHICHYGMVLANGLDYSWNMKLNMTAALLHNLLWIMWAVFTPPSAKYKCKIIYFVVLISAAATFEIMDFPPVALLIDAHSVWHALTAPLVISYWSFMTDHYLKLRRQHQLRYMHSHFHPYSYHKDV